MDSAAVRHCGAAKVAAKTLGLPITTGGVGFPAATSYPFCHGAEP